MTIAPTMGDAQLHLIKKLKIFQESLRKKWQGLNVLYSGQPAQGILLQKVKPPIKSKQRQCMEEREEIMKQYILKYNEVRDNTQYASSIRNTNPPVRIMPITIEEFRSKPSTSTVGYFSKHPDRSDSSLQFKILKSEAKLVQTVLESNGLVMTEGHSWNILWSNGHAKSYVYEGINQFQRINHFPCSFEATRKDKLCENIVRMQLKYGKAQFHIVPDTYLLPEEFNEFYSHFMEQKAQGITPLWIVKPNAMSRGRGIYIIDDIDDVPIDESCIISQYIPNPLLINGLKFDLRIYVTVTCVDP